MQCTNFLHFAGFTVKDIWKKIDKLYLLRTKPAIPDVSMNFDSHTGNTVDGTDENVTLYTF